MIPTIGSVMFRPVTASGPLVVAVGDVLVSGVAERDVDCDAGGVADGDVGREADGEDGPVAGAHDPVIAMVWSCAAVKGGELESMTVAENRGALGRCGFCAVHQKEFESSSKTSCASRLGATSV